MSKVLKDSGFTTVELLISLFIAALFLTSGYQLYAAIIKDSGETRSQIIAGDLASEYLQNYKSSTTNPCTESTQVFSSVAVDGISNVTVTIDVTCPYTSTTSISKITSTVSYNTPQKTTVHSTYINNPSLPTAPEEVPEEWITIGSQIWAKYNLNVGTRIDSSIDQTDNAVIEKYCYNNDENNCTNDGALYKWKEAMQYSSTEGSQGICPSGSHIPTDTEWSTLIDFLGSSTAGTQLAPGGASGLDIPFAGEFIGSFTFQSANAFLWSSTHFMNDLSAWYYTVINNFPTVSRSMLLSDYGASIRCIKD